MRKSILHAIAAILYVFIFITAGCSKQAAAPAMPPDSGDLAYEAITIQI